MQGRREDPTSRHCFRAEPVFNCNGRWYFQTREGIDIGPYDSKREAEIESGVLRALIRRSGGGGEALWVLRDFILQSFTMGRPLSVMIRSDVEHSLIDELPRR